MSNSKGLPVAVDSLLIGSKRGMNTDRIAEKRATSTSTIASACFRSFYARFVEISIDVLHRRSIDR